LSNLYPASKATVTSIITGSFNLSFFIFFVFDRLWNRFHFTYQEIFAGYSIVCAVAFSFSLFLWPDQPFSFQEQMLEEIVPDQASIARVGPIRAPSVFKKTSLAPRRPGQGGLPTLSATTTHDATATAASRENTALLNPGSAAAAAMDDIKEASFWEQLRSAPFVRVTVFIVVASFWANFYIGTIDIQLADGHLLSPEKQNYMVRLFTAVTTAGVLGIPIVGGLMDRWVGRKKREAGREGGQNMYVELYLDFMFHRLCTCSFLPSSRPSSRARIRGQCCRYSRCPQPIWG